ncbi:MAG: hypothetical protein J1F20_00125 [Muribaculaceae bacterium]|nr:hypothetical protein [Muribaculaceae bacterium]
MKKKIKRYDIIPLALLVYLGVMVYLGYPDYVAGVTSPWLYFGGTAFTLVVIILLRFNLKKREQYRRSRENDLKKNEEKNETDRN